MNFTDLIRSNATAFGETVTYAVPGADPAALAIIGWIEDPPTLGMGSDGRQILRLARASVAVTALAAPVRNAVITKASEEWTCYLVRPMGNGAAHELSLKRVETESKTAAPGRRIGR